MSIAFGVSKSVTEVGVRLSHSQAMILSKSSMVLAIDLEMKRDHRDLNTIIVFSVPHAKRNPTYTLLLQSTAGWPAFSLSDLSYLTTLEIDGDLDEFRGQVTLRNRGPVSMRIDQLYSTSTSVSLDTGSSFPLKLLSGEASICHFVYKVEKKLANFSCDIIVHGNFPNQSIKIPFYCKRKIPVIYLSRYIFHCGTVKPNSKTGPYPITVENLGNSEAQVNLDLKDNRIFSVKSVNGECSWTLAARSQRSIVICIEIQRSAEYGDFKCDVPLVVEYSNKKRRHQKLIISGRIQPKKSTDDPNVSIDFPSSWRFLESSAVYRRLRELLEDESRPLQQRVAEAVSPLIILFDSLTHSDVQLPGVPTSLSCDGILSAISSTSSGLPTRRNVVQQRISDTLSSFSTREWKTWAMLVEKVLEDSLPKLVVDLQGRSANENLQLAVKCAEQLSIIIESHSKSIDDQILARLIEYEQNNHKNLASEHEAIKRLLDYTTDLLLNPQAAGELPDENREQTRRLMEKLMFATRTIAVRKDLREPLRKFGMEMQTEINRNSLRFFNQLLTLAFAGQPINETLLIQNLNECHLSFQGNDLTRELAFSSDPSLAMRSLQNYVDHQIKQNKRSKNLLNFLKLAIRLSTSDQHFLLSDILHFPLVLTSMSSSLSLKKKKILNSLNRLISNSINVCQNWSGYIKDLCSVLEPSLDDIRIAGLQTLLTAVLRSEPNAICTDEMFLKIIASVLNLGSSNCQFASKKIVLLNSTNSPSHLLSIALHLTFQMRQATRNKIPWLRMRQPELDTPGQSPKTIEEFFKFACSEDSTWSRNAEKRDKLIRMVSLAVQSNNLRDLFEGLSNLCDMTHPDMYDQERNELLISIVKRIGSGTVFPAEAIKLGLSLTSNLHGTFERHHSYRSILRSVLSSDDCGKKFQKSYEELLPAMFAYLNPGKRARLIQIVVEFVEEPRVRSLLQLLSEVMIKHVANPKEQTLLINLCSLIPDVNYSNYVKDILSSMAGSLLSNPREDMLELALKILLPEIERSVKVGLGSIVHQMTIDPVQTLKMIKNLLPQSIQEGFDQAIDQWNPDGSNEQELIRTSSTISGPETAHALSISFEALRSSQKDRFQAFVQLSELKPKGVQPMVAKMKQLSFRNNVKFENFASMTLELVSTLAASHSTSLLFQTIVNVCKEILDSHPIDAILATLPISPGIENEVQRICRICAGLFSRQITPEQLVEVTFQAAMSLVDSNTAGSMLFVQQSIELIESEDFRSFAQLMVEHCLVQSSDRDMQVSRMFIRAFELFCRQNDPMNILYNLMNINELKPDLQSKIKLVHDMCLEFQSVINEQGQAKQEIVVHALHFLGSLMGREAPASLSLLARLLKAARSSDHDVALELVVKLIDVCVPPDISLTVHEALILLQQKLTRQPIDLEKLLSLSNGLLTEENKQLLVAARQPAVILMLKAPLPIEECIGAAASLMKAFEVDKETIELVHRAQEIRMLLINLRESVTNLYHEATLHGQTQQMKCITETIQKLLRQMNPNLSTLVTKPFEMIHRICNLLMAHNSLTRIFDSIAIVDFALEAFGQPLDVLTSHVSVTSERPATVDGTISRAPSILVNETAIATSDMISSVPNSTTTITANESKKNSEMGESLVGVEPGPTTCEGTEVLDEVEMKNRADAVKDIEQRISSIEIRSEELKQQMNNLIPDDQLALCEVITYLSGATMLTKRIQQVMDALQQMAANQMELQIRELSCTALPKLILASSELYQSMKWIEGSAGEICGHLKQKSHQIQGDLIEVLEKLSGSESLRQLWKSSKKIELVEDYEIPENGHVSPMNKETLANPTDPRSKIALIQHMMEGFEGARYGQGEIVDSSNIHRFGLHLDGFLSHDERDSSPLEEELEESKDISSKTQPRSSWTSRDVLLDIITEDKAVDKAGNLTEINSLDHMYVRLASDNETKSNANDKETHIKMKISRKDLEKLKKHSENTFNSLLKSVQNYDIGEISEACDPEQLPDVQLDRPRYALLARLTRNIQSMLLTRLRSALKKHLNQQDSGREDVRFEFIFCVDNSGSMSGKKIREALNTLVILMETFHRLEWKFGVVRFGAGQKILKALNHQSMYEQVQSTSNETDNLRQAMTSRGQYILESFTTDEKTLPATALKQIAENRDLFGQKTASNVKRFVIMITDGLSPQTDVDQFNNELKKAYADLYIVCIIPKQPKNINPESMNEQETFAVRHEEQAKQFSQRVAPDRNQVIEIGHLDLLTKTVVADLISIIEQATFVYSNSITSGSFDSDVNRIRPLKAFTLSHWREIEQWKCPDINFTGRAFNSDPNRKPEQQQKQINLDFSSSSDEFIKDFDQIMTDLDKSYSSAENEIELMINTERIFREMEEQCHSYIIEFVRMMEEYLFPANKATQSLPDTRGNRLHIPGIVKYLCTQGQYTRIYLNPIGSPRAEYRVALVLDQSVSMTGPTYFASVEILFSMCAALNRIGIDDFNVLTFGKDIRLIKSYKQTYDRAFFHHFRTSLNIDGETTLLTDAIFAASQLLLLQSNYQSNAGPMMIFVLTDGYDHRGSLLDRVLHHVEQQSITVVGLGIGLESNGVCQSFHDWIVAQNPRLTSDALIQWSNQQTDGQTPNDSLFHEEQSTNVQRYGTTDDVWNEEMNNYFDQLTKNTERTIDLTFSNMVYNRPLIVEICFVMDCTSSMGPWINACKQRIRSIAEGVQQQMEKECEKASILRIAFVAYRDFTDSDRIDSIDFHELDKIDVVEKKIASQRATGGDDICEDVQGGLEQALKLSWTRDPTRPVARILVWIGDCPGHTNFCHDQGKKWDKYLDGLPGVPQMNELIRQIKDRGIFLLLLEFTNHVKFMLSNIEKIFIDDHKNNQVKRVRLDSVDPTLLLTEVQQQISTIIASEFM